MSTPEFPYLISMDARIEFESRFVRHEDHWLWQGPFDEDGYGRFTYNQDGIHYAGAHRIAYLIWVGEIPVDPTDPSRRMDVDHKCQTITCVRPDHLQVRTRGDNVRMVNRRKTHCSKCGLPLSGENLYSYMKHGNPARGCRNCRRSNAARYRSKQRESLR